MFLFPFCLIQDVVYERIHKKQTSTFYQKPPAGSGPKEGTGSASKTQTQTPGASKPAAKPAYKPVLNQQQQNIGAQTDKQLIRDFLSGTFCIKGGAGWWKHEFCYGKKVIQYHEVRKTSHMYITKYYYHYY